MNRRFVTVNKFFRTRLFSSKVNFAKDYYRILEIPTNASSTQIRNNYLKQVKKWHPDAHTESPEELQKRTNERFLEVQEAYEILSNDSTKQEYDAVKLKVRKPKQYVKQGKSPPDPSQRARPRPQSSHEGTFTESDFEAYKQERDKRRYQKTAADYAQELRDKEWRDQKAREDRN